MSLLDTVEIPRRTMVLFFLVDTSGSMMGSKIGAVNSAIEEILPEISLISEENADAKIKVAVLQFSTGSKWLYEKPLDAGDIKWTYLQSDGVTDFGDALNNLNGKLSRNEFMEGATGSFAPAIFLMSDGEPTDEYEKELNELRKNKWFEKAIKVAVAIGDDANCDVLKEFTGNIETVLKVHTPEALKKMIRFVSVTASQIGSKSSGAGITEDGEIISKQDQFVQEIQYNLDAADLEDFDDDEW